ncbi:MAG: hypothetical protein KF689_12540 [Gemmatimonadaceae bacterium]|nr:hypothetical protein [Gemmatimonadaceae bacterium]MCW5827190.1 hypothetical protein [Gemmatimonadaceae bacterium]
MRILLRAVAVLTLAASPLLAQQDPPRRLNLGSGVEEVQPRDTARTGGVTSREMRSAFVRTQLVLGLAAYGPAFAVMLGDEPATRVAAYMVMAGGSFFAASELARQVEVTPARQVLSSRMAWRGTINGLLLGNAASMPQREVAALTLIGGLSGTAAGLMIGGGLTEGEAVAAVVGHDLVAASAYALTWVFDPKEGDGEGLSYSARIAIPLVLGWGGYALGRSWAGNAAYEVTAGDAMLLWLGAGIGMTGASTFLVGQSPSTPVVAGSLLAGGLVGVWGADRLLVRKYDHSRSEGLLLASGAGAGALMGIGLGVLISGEADRNAAPTMAFATMGAIGGAWLTSRYAQPALDERRRYEYGSRIQLNPAGAVAVAAKAPGIHPLLRITF